MRQVQIVMIFTDGLMTVFLIGFAIFFLIGIAIYEITYARKKKKYEHILMLKEAGQSPEGLKGEPSLPVKLAGIPYMLRGVGVGSLGYILFMLLVAGVCLVMYYSAYPGEVVIRFR